MNKTYLIVFLPMNFLEHLTYNESKRNLCKDREDMRASTFAHDADCI